MNRGITNNFDCLLDFGFGEFSKWLPGEIRFRRLKASYGKVRLWLEQ